MHFIRNFCLGLVVYFCRPYHFQTAFIVS